ncbi:MAG TPA: cupin domain-containing protein [Candidatus Acidoferrum sp.]|nr:cupin domain-containing protein [Candidatus Acidoferrum sp.]
MKLWFSVAPAIVLLTLCVSQESSAPAPVPVEQEPHHHLLLKNENLLVLRVTLQPGEWSSYHTHSVDDVAVWLGHSKTAQQLPNEAESAAIEQHPGNISVRTLHETPFTHRVHNLGPGLFDVLDVEILQRPEHPSAAVAGPVAAENPSARVYKWTLAPGGVTPMHTHERPYLIIAATEFNLKMTAPDGQSFAHEIKAGDFHWVTTKVTHTLANAGTGEGQIIEIELK